MKHEVIAHAVKRDVSWVSKLVAGETGVRLDDLEAFLGALQLKIVPAESVVVDGAELHALRTLARKELERS